MSLPNIPKKQILTQNTIVQREHEDDAAAKRVILVDPAGDPVTPENPLPVVVEAEIQVDDVTIKDSDGDELEVNPDGSINVVIQPDGGNIDTPNVYGEVASIPASTPTVLLTYTAPLGKQTFLQRVEVSGENIATYEVLKNGNTIAKKRTYFGGTLNEDFDFLILSSANGLELSPGDSIQVVVTHGRPMVADFNARLQSIERT